MKSSIKTNHTAILYAILAAALYAINIPLSKRFLLQVPPAMMAAFLYLGAGFGLMLFHKIFPEKEPQEALTKKELPYTIGMVLLDIVAPILLMFGLEYTNSANASLLNNFEIVATSLIAFLIFQELISKKLVIAILLVTLSSILLSFEGEGSFDFNFGSLLVLGAACCWGLENNCTRMLSSKSSVQITTIKGVCSGFGGLVIALLIGEHLPSCFWILAVMLLGFVSYGLGINLYIKAQKDLGAAKTSAYYSIAPFLGVLFGMILLQERPGINFYLGLFLMILATILIIKDSMDSEHNPKHIHFHRHGIWIHAHEHSHVQEHSHAHGNLS